MKSTYKILLSSALIAGCSASAMAQASYSGYHLENYIHRYQLNPALTDTTSTEKNFVAMPILGNLNIGMRGNLHTNEVLFNRGGKTVLFTNPQVSVADALKGIGDRNIVGGSTQFDILAAGFEAFGGRNVVTLSTVIDANVMVPGSLFRLAKEGVSNQTYDISDFRANSTGYAQLQFNHQRDLSQWVPGLKAGAAFKMLFGLVNFDAYLNNATLELGENNWRAVTNGVMYANLGNMHYTTKYSEETGQYYVDGLDMDGFGVKGFGIGFDLGATYDWQDFQFSLALLDLGFISWSGTQTASTNGVKTFDTDAFSFGVEGDDAKDEWNDNMKPALFKLYQLHDLGNTGTRTRALRATLNWGVDYEFPYYRPLHFGLVNTTRFNGPFTYTDFRISANVRPVKCFSASANLAAGTYGVGFGWLANVNLKGFSFFIGMDRTFGKMAKQGLPLNSNGEFNMGMNFPF
ncbi:MAG: hypothetical protein K2L35_01720 [Muribaculaceae bacterium]|nr:hypothetical protein [Muribaculaceae bacterium]